MGDTRILVDGPAAPELAAALDAILGRSAGQGWLVSAVLVGHPWWCINVLDSPDGRLAGWSRVALRADLPRLLAEALAQAGLARAPRPGPVIRPRRRAARDLLGLAS